MQIAGYESEHDNLPKKIEIPWGELALELTKHQRTECNPCPGGNECREKSKNGAWAPHVTEGTRSRANVKQVTALVLDVDHVSDAEIARIVVELEADGLEFVAHSTHSHKNKSADDGCWRLVFPVSRPMLPVEYEHIREAVAKVYGIHADPNAKDPSRLYFLPTAPSRGPDPIGAHSPGEPLNVDEWVGATASPSETPIAAPEPVSGDSEAISQVDMARIRTRLKQVRDPDSKNLVDLILAGKPIAKEGERDAKLNKACSVLGFTAPPGTPTWALLEIMRPSLNVMPGPPPNPSNPSFTWLDEARDMLDRSAGRRRDRDAEQIKFAERIRQSLSRESSRLGAEPSPVRTADAGSTAPSTSAASSGAEDSNSDVAAAFALARESVAATHATADSDVQPYTPEQVTKWAEEQECTLEEFERRWVIQHESAYYVFVNGRYRSPLSKMALENSLPRDLARAPITLFHQAESGEFRKRKMGDILSEHSTVARKLRADLALQKSRYYAEEQVFVEAICPLRPIKAVEHPEIHEWLQLLGNRESEKLLDWLAVSMDLSKQMCGIYFEGPPAVGKTLFVHGLARLWTTGGPTELDRILDDFNSSLANCPLIFADEGLPQRKGLTAELRRIIGSKTRTLNRKFLPEADISGATRLIVAGNNDQLLSSLDELSANDVDAVAERLLHIKSDARPAKYLASLGGQAVCDQWITHDKLAEHALWLQQTRKVIPAKRFIVEGSSQELQAQLVVNGGLSGQLCEWLVRWLVDPQGSGPNSIITRQHLIVAGEGELWVGTEAMAKEADWTRYVSTRVPTTTAIGRGLKQLSTDSVRTKIGERFYRYHRVKTSLLESWTQSSHVSDAETLYKRLNAPNELIASRLKVREG